MRRQIQSCMGLRLLVNLTRKGVGMQRSQVGNRALGGRGDVYLVRVGNGELVPLLLGKVKTNTHLLTTEIGQRSAVEL